MKQLIGLAAFCLAVFVPAAGAHSYALQFTPNPGYRGLAVAGYKFTSAGVMGNCSYYTVSGSSGKGGGSRGAKAHTYDQTCTWDLYGNLLSVVPGAPAAPAPLYTSGNQVVYALNANGDSTGTGATRPDQGFVNTPGSHYTWLTPNNNGVGLQMAYTLVVTLRSDGDSPLNITAVQASALHGAAAVKSTTCIGQIEVGDKCSVTVTYDTTKLTGATYLVYDTLRVDVTSDAGGSADFVQNYTIVMPH